MLILISFNSFPLAEWNLMNPNHGESDGSKVVADFMGLGKSSLSHHHSDLTAYNQMHHQTSATEPDYLYMNTSSPYGFQTAVPLSTVTANSSFEYQDNANSLESLTLSMGNTNSSKRSTYETNIPAENCTTNSTTSTAVVEAASPAARRASDTFGQRTSIYRGVTRYIHIYIFDVCFPHYSLISLV